MHWGPQELLPLDLGLPLFKGGEFLVVLVEVLKELFEQLIDLLINPGSILEFDYKVQSVDHRHMFQA